MSINPYEVVRQFEESLCRYTGAPYAVTVSSCTMALLLAVRRHVELGGSPIISIPKKTYVGVPMSIRNAGARVSFHDEDWAGAYRLRPSNIWDSARWFTEDIWKHLRGHVCVSFHASKTLGDTQGGAILHDDPVADAWYRRMRFDGRTEGIPPNKDSFKEIGFHCYMSSDTAARLLLKLHSLPKKNSPIPNDPYPDLSKFEVFNAP